MPVDLTEPTLVARLAFVRWGVTRFHCPHCGHEWAFNLRARPRVCECKECGRQTSVTAGTVLHGTKLPLRVWFLRAEEHEISGAIPTCSHVADWLGVSRSTAWHLSQRLFLCAEVLDLVPVVDPEWCHSLLMRLPVRRPRGPISPDAPQRVRSLHEQFRDRRYGRREVVIGIHLPAGGPVLEGVALNQGELGLRVRAPEVLTRPVERWLRANLLGRHATVSLRWLPRWIRALFWGRRREDIDKPPPTWLRAAVACGRRPLRCLDPWGAAPP